MFFKIMLGILSGPGALLLARFFKHKSYVSLSKYSCSGICGVLFFSKASPFRSCHRYCLTPQVHLGMCSGW